MRRIVPLLIATAAFAAEAQPLVEIALPDAARLRAHVAASIYGTLWADPAFAPLRAQAEAGLGALKDDKGVDFARWYEALANAGMVVLPPAAEGGAPRAAMVIDVGALAPELFALWRDKSSGGTTPAEVAGTDEAFRETSADGSRPLVTRQGGVIASTSDGSPIPAWRPAAGASDLSVRLDGAALGAVLAQQSDRAGEAEAMLGASAVGVAAGRTTYDVKVVPEGVHERLASDAPAPWFKPVERAALDRLPAKALTAVAFGLDGAKLWPLLRERALTAAAQARGISADEAEAAIDAELARLGVKTRLGDLVSGVAGTISLAISPAAPFPAVSLSLPRSAGIDELVAMLAARIGGEVPASGATSMLPLPGAPLMLNLACDERAWLITSDPAVAKAWLGGAGPAWSASPAAALAWEQAGADPVLIGASDTPTLVRTLIPFVALGMGRGVDPKTKQTTLAALGRVAELAKTGWIVGRRQGAGIELELRGLTGTVLLPVLAGLTLPAVTLVRAKADETAAAAALKSGVFPAQIQFQSGGYVDADGNGIGDFGFLDELSGGTVAGSDHKLALLPPTWNAATPLVRGYRFATWVYAGPGAASGNANERAAAKAAAETGFVTYAWPAQHRKGARIFAITTAGTVHATTWDGNPPEWFALWGSAEQAWTGKPVWPVHKR